MLIFRLDIYVHTTTAEYMTPSPHKLDKPLTGFKDYKVYLCPFTLQNQTALA